MCYKPQRGGSGLKETGRMSRLHTPLRATASLVRVSAPKSFQGAREKGDFMRKRQLAILALVAACLTTLAVIAGSATAGPFTVAPPAVISAPSPFTNCNIGLPDGGTNYLNAEVEPWVAVNPANASNIIGVYQQDRWSNGGARGLVASVTHDGGASWSRSWAPFTFCSGGTAGNGGDFERASDPWVTFAPNGGASWEPARAIFAPRANRFSIGNQIAVLPNGDLVDIMFLGHGSGNQRSGWDVAVVRSTDRGVTWSSPLIVGSVQAVGVAG